MELGLRKFTETDWMAFAGCESENPLIAEVTLSESDIFVIVDGLIMEVGIGEETTYGKTLDDTAGINVIINLLLPAILTNVSDLVIGLGQLGFTKLTG